MARSRASSRAAEAVVARQLPSPRVRSGPPPGARLHQGGVSAPSCLPNVDDPRLVAYAPAAVRRLCVFGAPVEAVLVPARRRRLDAANVARPAFARSRAAGIVAAESIWRGDGMALTPNAFPFAHGQRLLWPLAPLREPDAALWQAAFAWADAAGGAALVNNVGAASSIGRAHAHLCAERLPFLGALPERPCAADLIDVPAGAALVSSAVVATTAPSRPRISITIRPCLCCRVASRNAPGVTCSAFGSSWPTRSATSRSRRRCASSASRASCTDDSQKQPASRAATRPHQPAKMCQTTGVRGMLGPWPLEDHARNR